MLRSLSGARFGIILLPREARSLPLVEDVVDEVFSERGVNSGGSGFVGARSDCDVLDDVNRLLVGYLGIRCCGLRGGFSRRGSSC